MKNSITPGQISQNNLKLIYQYIYQNGPVSQQDIAYDLRLSRPTITTKIGELESKGLIRKEGKISSELAGRKASAYSISPEYRSAIGVEILKTLFETRISCLIVCRGFADVRTNAFAPF